MSGGDGLRWSGRIGRGWRWLGLSGGRCCWCGGRLGGRGSFFGVEISNFGLNGWSFVVIG